MIVITMSSRQRNTENRATFELRNLREVVPSLLCFRKPWRGAYGASPARLRRVFPSKKSDKSWISLNFFQRLRRLNLYEIPDPPSPSPYPSTLTPSSQGAKRFKHLCAVIEIDCARLRLERPKSDTHGLIPISKKTQQIS